MKKILLSLGVIAIVAVGAIGATRSFFSDTETSTGNTFTAGAIDLKIDNESYVTNPKTGVFEWNEGTSWASTDLTNELFFNFLDLKPGDMGEDTISLVVDNNDAYACMNIAITGTPENGQTEPEAKVDPTAGDNEGELQNALNFVFWADDGDNVFEVGENVIAEGSAADIFTGNYWTLADTQKNIWNEDEITGPMMGTETYYVAKMWCLGDLEKTPVNQDDHGKTDDNGPTSSRGTGFTCSGASVGNETQTDGIEADIAFYAVQSRNNDQFLCSSLDQQGIIPQTRTISLENKNIDWQILSDDEISGFITYSHNDSVFHGVVSGTGLVPGGKYQITLNGPGTCTATDDAFADLGSNAFQSGYWNNGTGLEPTCGNPGEGVYNMDLIGDHYTFIADSNGAFNHPFNITMPAGNYSDVKVLVKKMLDTHVSPWSDTGSIPAPGYPAFNLYETASINFTILP